MTRVGVLGGSFDPPHRGHLLIADEALRRLSLDAVVFVPAGFQWMKDGNAAASREDRLEMTRLAVAGHPAFRVSDVEINRSGPSYTADTLPVLLEQCGPDTELFLILGEDTVADLAQWSRPGVVVKLATLVVMPRGGAPLDVDALEASVPGVRDHVIRLDDAPLVDVSSSAVRDMTARGESIHGMAPDGVADYIAARGLYGALR